MDTSTTIGLICIFLNTVYALESPFFCSQSTGDWSEGESDCLKNNGRLVTIDTQGKYDRILDWNRNNILSKEFFIGLSTTSTNCNDYIWSSGKPLVWSKWRVEGNDSEPDQCITHQCVRLSFGLFRTTNCKQQYQSLCEYGTFFPNSSLFRSAKPMNFYDSFIYCSMIGGRLLVLNNEDIQTKAISEVELNVGTAIEHWIGLGLMTQECGNITWVSGEAMTWSNFDKPFDCSNGRCVAWSIQKNVWINVDCSKAFPALCENGYEETERFFCSKGKVTWKGANDECAEVGGELASLETAKQYIHAFASQGACITNSVWIGLHTDPSTCKEYTWSNGRPLSWANWLPDNPKTCGNENGVGISRLGMFTTTTGAMSMYALCVVIAKTPSSSTTTATTQITKTTTFTMTATETSTTFSPFSFSSLQSTTITKTPVDMETSLITTVAEETSTNPISASLLYSSTTKSTIGTATAIEPTTISSNSETSITNVSCIIRNTNITKLSHGELLEIITQLKAELSVNKENTSTYRRKRISVYESRPSSMIMGGVACASMFVLICGIVVPDIITLLVFLFKCRIKENVVNP